MSELIKYQRELRNSWLNRNSAEDEKRNSWLNRSVKEEPNCLKLYWKDRSKNRKELIKIISDLAKEFLNPSILEYGAWCGVNLKLLKKKWELYAVEPNKDAYEFLTRKLKRVKALQGEDEIFCKTDFPGRHINISFINAVFYSMAHYRVKRVLRKLCRISDFIVIGNQIENIGGGETKLMELEDMTGGIYKSLCHPFKKMLNEFSFKIINIKKVPWSCLALTGFIIANKKNE